MPIKNIQMAERDISKIQSIHSPSVSIKEPPKDAVS